jgi:hypothetical protein
MPKKTLRHLNFYKKCFKTLDMPKPGLCRCADCGLICESTLKEFTPTDSDHDQNVIEGTMDLFHPNGYWGAGLNISEDCRGDSFTPLRQTIVLFMAAMNNEL